MVAAADSMADVGPELLLWVETDTRAKLEKWKESVFVLCEMYYLCLCIYVHARR
jgi:hypothetical protein